MLNRSPFFNKIVTCANIEKAVENIENYILKQEENYVETFKMVGLDIDMAELRNNSKLSSALARLIYQGENNENLSTFSRSLMTNLNELFKIEKLKEDTLFNGKNISIRNKFVKNIDLILEFIEDSTFLTKPNTKYYYIGSEDDISNEKLDKLRREGKDFTIIELSFKGLFKYLGIENEDFKINYVDKADASVENISSESGSSSDNKDVSQNNLAINKIIDSKNENNDSENSDDENGDGENQ